MFYTTNGPRSMLAIPLFRSLGTATQPATSTSSGTAASAEGIRTDR